jgi:hypothetical protein
MDSGLRRNDTVVAVAPVSKHAKLGPPRGRPQLKSAFEEFSSTYVSGSQSARVKTERWVADWMYCINCGAPRLSQFSQQ